MKPQKTLEHPTDALVTPRAGVWIETEQSLVFLYTRVRSPPVRGCGLKLGGILKAAPEP